jgi:hypothetical protein
VFLFLGYGILALYSANSNDYKLQIGLSQSMKVQNSFIVEGGHHTPLARIAEQPLCDGRIDAMVEMLKVQRSRCIVKY